jgi:hypothetical protein
MAKKPAIVIDNAFIVALAEAELFLSGQSANHKASQDAYKAEQSKGKVNAYADFMVGLAPLVKANGALDAKVSEQLKKAMHEAGISKACARRYIDNSVGAFKAERDLLKAAKTDAQAVLDVFEELEVDTESAIKKLFFQAPDPLDVLAQRLAKLDEAELADVLGPRLTAARERLEGKEKAPAKPAKVAEVEEPVEPETPPVTTGALRYEANLLGGEVGTHIAEASDAALVKVIGEAKTLKAAMKQAQAWARKQLTLASLKQGNALDQAEAPAQLN